MSKQKIMWTHNEIDVKLHVKSRSSVIEYPLRFTNLFEGRKTD